MTNATKQPTRPHAVTIVFTEPELVALSDVLRMREVSRYFGNYPACDMALAKIEAAKENAWDRTQR